MVNNRQKTTICTKDHYLYSNSCSFLLLALSTRVDWLLIYDQSALMLAQFSSYQSLVFVSEINRLLSIRILFCPFKLWELIADIASLVSV